MELHQLRYFVAVANLGNFTRAAEKCFVAQPSLSQQIIKLEKELGQPLLIRLGRKTRLTEAGQILYRQATEILTAVEDAKRQVTEAADSGRGRVVLGAIPTVAPYLVPPLLKKFARSFPAAEVTLHENLTEQTLKGCQAGELDIGLVALPVAAENLVTEPLFTEELLLATHPRHALGKKKRVTIKDLGKESFILLSETHCLGEQIVSFCKQQACLPAVSCQSSQLLTVQEFVALNHGVSLIPEMAAVMDRSRLRQYRSLSGAKPTRTLAMVWHQHRYQSPLVKEFIAAIREQAASRKKPA